MEWNKFVESPKEYPEILVQNAIKGFSQATDGLLEIKVEPQPGYLISAQLNTHFSFRVELFSNFVTGYRFILLEFGYDIELFPVKFAIETSILEELDENSDILFKRIMLAEDESDFKMALDWIFKSKRFNEIVAGLMKIARKNSEF